MALNSKGSALDAIKSSQTKVENIDSNPPAFPTFQDENIEIKKLDESSP